MSANGAGRLRECVNAESLYELEFKRGFVKVAMRADPYENVRSESFDCQFCHYAILSIILRYVQNIETKNTWYKKSKYRKSSIKPPGGLFNLRPQEGGAY